MSKQLSKNTSNFNQEKPTVNLAVEEINQASSISFSRLSTILGPEQAGQTQWANE